jgi:formylglycine-generating enzyme required for sulfatase activity
MTGRSVQRSIRYHSVALLVLIPVTILAGSQMPVGRQAAAAIFTVTTEPSPVRTVTPMSIPAVRANAEWTPIVQSFDGAEMVLVPPGCFMMGSTDQAREQPVHKVCFDQPFWIDRYEVTNAAYRQFVEAGGYTMEKHWSADGWRWVQNHRAPGPHDHDGFADPQQPRVGGKLV